MRKGKGGLGRGLGSLIPREAATEEAPQAVVTTVPPVEAQAQAPIETAAPEPVTPETGATAEPAPVQAAGGLLEVPIESISPNPHQPRQAMNETQLDELADSIRAHGVIQPLLVTRAAREGTYTLVAGERRWRAAGLAGLSVVPVMLKEASSRDMLELALVENLQRADLNPLEEAAAYRALVDDFGVTQDDVAARVGKSRGAVSNSMRLLRLPPSVQESLALGLISEGHARAILQVPDEQIQMRLAEQTVAEGLSVRQVEALARRLAERPHDEDDDTRPGKKETDGPIFDEIRELEDRFRNALGTKVQLSRSSRGGKLVIYFYSNEELDRIYGTIVGEEEA